MIITKIQGGLGNQIFQYAIGRHLAYINNTELKIDNSSYKQDKLRRYGLDKLNITGTIATEDDLKKIGIPEMSSTDFVLRIKRNIFKRIESTKNLNERRYIKQPSFKFHPEILRLKNNIYLEGSWQSEKYFKDIENIISEELTLKNKMLNDSNNFLALIRKNNSVSIHIRRGDYASNPEFTNYYGLCSIDYYKEAIKKISGKIENPHFFLFSDDPAWVEENLKFDFPKTFISGNNLPESEELILMSKCLHNITANSSFSWWGSWLNNNPDKIVISPKKWFNGCAHNINDLRPSSWIKI